ncbi:hypothetical protein ACFL4Z_03970, partial [candidate division KSB1 bacterium]
MDEQHFELAAEIGKLFKIDKEKTMESAFKTWERHMRNGRYDKALQFKKDYKILSAWTKKIAR